MAEASPDRPAVVRFGPFTLDLRAGELTRNGMRTRLQDQPLALLACLLEHPGQLVTREDLRRRLWPHGTIVDFEHGVNTALKRLRDALGDSADHPVYIETVPRRGYRFLAAVEAVAREGVAAAEATPGGHGPRNGALVPGASLRVPAAASAYRVLDQLGAGGMGEVYRAEDLVLKRQVALKVLPAAVAGDPDRLARFRREAEVLASLNHPHICTLHAIGEARPEDLGIAVTSGEAEPVSRPFLVMEHIEGQTLAARLEKGPLPPTLVCEVGAQIADALAAAHRHGVVHRDLKPANIMLTRTGAGRSGVPHVKLLDFGLAKLAGHGEQPAIAFDSAAETHRAGLTGQGTVLGTLPYMAPEQVEGKEADARTDIWALGTVLYEMATGTPAFAADSFASLAGQILTAEPPAITARQPLTPPALEHAVTTCLPKDPDARWQSASDVARELRWSADEGRVGRTPSGGIPRETAAGAARAEWTTLRRWRFAVVAGVLVALLAWAGAVWLWSGKAQPSAWSPRVVRSQIGVAPAENVFGGGLFTIVIPTPGGARTAMTWTPDGRALVFVGRVGNTRRLYVRRLDENEPRLYEGTQGAQLPAVSPDGKWIAFYQRGIIKKVPFEGGPVLDVSSEAVGYPPFGLAWDDTGAVYYDRPIERGIWVIPPGGKARALTTPRLNMTMHSHPWPLPGGRALIYTNRKRCCTWGDEEIVVQPLPAGEPKVLVVNGADARYVPPGYLVFMRRGVVLAVPFDIQRLEVRGTPAPVLDNVLQSLWAGNPYDASGIGQFAVSAAGHLAYLRGPLVPVPPNELVSIDKRGRVTVLPAPVDSYSQLRLSPDGQRLAVGAWGLTEMAVYVYDLTRGTMHAVSRGAEAGNLVWTRDGQRLLFQLNRNGSNSVVAHAADGTGQPQALLPDSEFFPVEMRPDGKAVAGFTLAGGKSEAQLATLSGDTAQVAPFPQMAGPTTQWPAFSPDGRWLAYGSATSDRGEVYVQAYPGPGIRMPVSVEGGSSPAWHPNGREIFFLGPVAANRLDMMAVEFTPGSPPRVGRPRRLFIFDGQKLMLSCVWFRCYDVSSDGERFYGWQQTVSPNPAPVTHINLIMNWFEELKAKVPVK